MTDSYFAMPGLNWSKLKHLKRSALNYRHVREHGVGDALHFRLGRAVHALALEDREAFVVFPGKARRGRDWEWFKQHHADEETILTEPEHQTVIDMVEALLKHEHFSAFHGRREHVLTWTDKATGILCKCRIDDVDGCITELKSTAQEEMQLFANDCAKYLYANQLVWYEWGALENGIPMTADHQMVTVQSMEPHDVWRFYFGIEAAGVLERARQENRALLDQYARCVESGEWPGACPEPVDIGKLWPRWDKPREDSGVDFSGL